MPLHAGHAEGRVHSSPSRELPRGRWRDRWTIHHPGSAQGEYEPTQGEFEILAIGHAFNRELFVHRCPRWMRRPTSSIVEPLEIFSDHARSCDWGIREQCKCRHYLICDRCMSGNTEPSKSGRSTSSGHQTSIWHRTSAIMPGIPGTARRSPGKSSRSSDVSPTPVWMSESISLNSTLLGHTPPGRSICSSTILTPNNPTVNRHFTVYERKYS